MSKQAQIGTQELRRAQQAAAVKRTRQRRLVRSLGAVVIAGLAVAIGVVIWQAAHQNQRTLPEVTGKVVAPAHLTSNGAIPVGHADAPVTVEVYYDYMCSFCGEFEKANSGELDKLVADGTARVGLRPLAFLDHLSSGTEYSSRTANAIAVVANADPDHVWAFHSALYQQQPAEGSKGLTDQQIADIATAAGVPTSVSAQFTDGTYRPWVASTTQQAFKSGVEHTPTIKINGEEFKGNAFTVGPLTQAIESAASGQ